MKEINEINNLEVGVEYDFTKRVSTYHSEGEKPRVYNYGFVHVIEYLSNDYIIVSSNWSNKYHILLNYGEYKRLKY